MKILIPVDGSELSLDAVRYALRLRNQGLQAEFLLATVQEPDFLKEIFLASDSEIVERAGGAGRWVALEGAQALFKEAGVPVELEIGSGSPALTLIEIAKRHGCEAIILSSRGMGALHSGLLGSVSQAVLHASTVPVTLVKHAEADALA